MLPYYYGNPAETVRLAGEAQAIARGKVSSPTALAAAAEGRALARLGDHDSATRALTQAQDLFARLNSRTGEPIAFDFTEQRLYLYLSGAHAHLPDAHQAQAVQEQALAQCPHGPAGIDPALIQLDQAMTLARAGHPTDACELAQQTLINLAPQHRTSIVFVRARDVRNALPSPNSADTALRGLDETLALATSATSTADGPTHG